MQGSYVIPAHDGTDGEASTIIKRHTQLKADRSAVEAHWEDTVRYVWPSFMGFTTGNAKEGAYNVDKLFTSSPSIALGRFASAMEQTLTPRNNRWHRIKSGIPELMRLQHVARYYDDLTNALFKYRYEPTANFASQNYLDYLSLGSLGTCCMFTDANTSGRGLRYKSNSMGEIIIQENHQGVVDTVYRKFSLHAHQAKRKFKEATPPQIEAVLRQNPDQVFWFIQCVEPNTERDPERIDARGMAYKETYVFVEGQQVIQRGGYRTFPFQIGRYIQFPGSLYGQSPAGEALPAIKTLNVEKRTFIKQGQRIVDPVLLVHDDGVLNTFALKSGALNKGGVTKDGKELVKVLPTGDLSMSPEMMVMEKNEINDSFLITLFQILIESPEMTATEVLERAREKGALLSPTMGRQEAERLGPMIHREVDILQSQGLLPPPPPEVIEAGAEYEVEYDSPLSRAQRAEEAAGFMRSLEVAIAHFNASGGVDTRALDWFDIDQAMPDIMAINAMPARWRRSLDAVKEIRQEKQEQTETQELIQAAPGAAAMMKATAALSNGRQRAPKQR